MHGHFGMSYHRERSAGIQLSLQLPDNEKYVREWETYGRGTFPQAEFHVGQLEAETYSLRCAAGFARQIFQKGECWMTSLYIICFVLLSIGAFLLLGLTPENVTDDIMRIFAPGQTLRDKVLIAKNKKKSHRITKMLLHTRDALTAVGKSGQFTLTCTASLVLLIAGCIVAVMVDNFFMIPVFALALAAIPFLFARNTIKAYDKHIREEMETAMSIVTTSYIRTEDIVGSV